MAGVTLASRYSIQEVIGVGGMGSVYRARDMHFPNVTKLVAVKEMINSAPDPLVRQTIVQNFEREANLLATLNHASIPRINDYFSLDSRSYLVLDFIKGKDMEAIISDTNGFLPEEQVLGWAVELCDVLDYLHKHFLQFRHIFFHIKKKLVQHLTLIGKLMAVTAGMRQYR